MASEINYSVVYQNKNLKTRCLFEPCSNGLFKSEKNFRQLKPINIQLITLFREIGYFAGHSTDTSS